MSKIKIALTLKQYLSWQRLTAGLALCLLVVISLHHSLGAQTVTEGYGADQSLQRGMIVRLKKDDPTKVEPVNSDHAEDAFGVVVSANEASLTLSNEDQRVFVATTGRFEILVSDQEGSVNSGDYITVSPLSGVGLKANPKDVYVIARALGTFDTETTAVSKVDIKTSDGTNRTINVGRVQADIGVANNPLNKGSNNVPDVLRRASESVAGRPVSTWRIYAAASFFTATMVLAASLLYGGVRSSISAVGRNPLSKQSVTRSLAQVILGGMVIFVTGISAVYLILRL